MKNLTVMDPRPQFVNLAANADAVAQRDNGEHVIVDNGQHNDPAVSDVYRATPPCNTPGRE